MKKKLDTADLDQVVGGYRRFHPGWGGYDPYWGYRALAREVWASRREAEMRDYYMQRMMYDAYYGY